MLVITESLARLPNRPNVGLGSRIAEHASGLLKRLLTETL
jgi:hypothetical protein